MRNLFVAIACLSLGAQVSAEQFKVWGVGADDHLNVRTGPSTRFDVVMGLPNAWGGLTKEVCVLVKPEPEAPKSADYPEWCLISDGGGPKGWVAARYLEHDEGPPADLLLLQGFRANDDPCRIIGESAATVNFLDHTRWLIGCPSGSPAIGLVLDEFGGEIVSSIGGYDLLSVPK